jgi:hypothetical protein
MRVLKKKKKEREREIILPHSSCNFNISNPKSSNGKQNGSTVRAEPEAMKLKRSISYL